MLSPGGIGDALLSGWIVTWPTKLLSLIWLAWVVSWVVAAFWSGRTKSHVPTRDSWIYRLPILHRGDPAVALDSPRALGARAGSTTRRHRHLAHGRRAC